MRMAIAVQVERYPDGRFRARFMGLFLNLFREFTGINSILVYAGLVIGPINDTLGPYANFALTLIAFMATVASHLFVVDRFGRRNIMIISAVVFFVCNIVIMTGMLVSSSTMVFVGMMIEILFFGLTYSTVSSIYPA